MSDDLDLLIIGAGPVGLTAAVEAKRLGLSVRIIERKDKRTTHDSRAVVVHPRVMELLEPIGDGSVIEEIQKSSFHLGGVFFYMERWFGKGKHGDGYDHLNLNLKDVKWGDTEFPNLYFLPQFETERIMEEALNAAGVKVDYGYALESLIQTDNTVTTELVKNGSTETVSSKWVIGADGGRSKTRELVGIEMNRNKSDIFFIIADVIFKGDPPLDSHAPGKGGHVFPTDKGVVAMFPLPGEHNYRLLGQAPKGVTSKDQLNMDEEFFEKFLLETTGKTFDVELGPWQTIFNITHGTSDSYRKGNVILAGDASHVHSPVGGQGMNLGMQDANNILWKLAWVKRMMENASSDDEKKAAAACADIILGSYHTERHSLGRKLVRTVEFATNALATRNPFVKFLRNMRIRRHLPTEKTRDNFRKAGQLELEYPPDSSSIVVANSKASKTSFICSSGQRLPNIRLHNDSKLHSHIDRVHHTWVFLNHSQESSASGGQAKVACVSASKYDEQVSFPYIAAKAYAAKQVILVRPDLWVAGIAETQQELIDELKKAGLDDTALALM